MRYEDHNAVDTRLAARLKRLRGDHGWSLDDAAAQSGVSRATLSRLEKAEVSATAQTLGKLCAAYGITMSRLLASIEHVGAALSPRVDQAVWTDAETGFTRRSVSPPSVDLAGEAIEGAIPAGVRIAYDAPPREGLEHHLALLEGALIVTVDGRRHTLGPGDCLRYRLYGPSAFETPPSERARYLLFMV